MEIMTKDREAVECNDAPDGADTKKPAKPPREKRKPKRRK